MESPSKGQHIHDNKLHAAILLAMYIAVGEKQGVEASKLTGTIQNDILRST
jgi:methylmalonyl-CoA mutase N-terminal domain/subunit